MKNYKIICITQIYNELENGNLKRFVKYVKPLCDALIVYDDASTDGSYEYMQKVTPYVLQGKKNDFEQEIAHKKLLLEKAKELGADFVFYLDADEVFSNGAKKKLQQLAKQCVKENIDGLQFHKINLWRSKTWQRVDSLFDIGWFVHFWRITPQTRYESVKKGLHQNPYPSTLKQIRRSKEISVLHYGFSNEKNLAYKYLTYKSYGQRGYIMLDRLISEEKLQLKKVSEKIFPEGLYVSNEQMPTKKSFSESLTYVEKYKKNFLSYRPNLSSKVNKQLPLVTIITSTYNRAKLLPQTMVSILSQDYPNIEYIIVDDGSTDNTHSVVRQLKKKFRQRKIVYLKQKNAGETAAVNKGFSLAKGEILAVVSSDDPLLPGAVDEIVEYLQDHPKVLAVYPNWEMIDEKGHTVQTVYPKDYDYLSMIKEHYCMPGPGTFFRRKVVKLTGGRTEAFTFLADFAFWLKAGMYGQLYHYPKILATFRVHGGSQGVYARGKEMAQEHRKLVEWVFSDHNLLKVAQKVKSAAYASAYFHAAKESTSFVPKIGFYTRSLVSDVPTFLGKLLYEGVKIKHVFGNALKKYSA